MANPLAPPPPVGQEIDSRQFRDWFYSLYALLGQPGSTLGTMAYQNADSVAITGGALGGVGITGSTVNNTPIGQTFAAAGRFTNLQADGTVSGNGFTNYFAAPPPLGSTTPNRVNTNALKTTALTGYLYGNGTSTDVTASTTIPWSVITGAPAFVTPKYGSFHYDNTTTLSTAIPNGTSTSAIVVASTTGFASSGYILIEKEIIGYTGTTSTTFTGITRSLFTTSGAGHAVGSNISSVQGTAANTATAVLFNATDYSNGISIGSPVSRIVFANAGMYNLQFSLQATNADTVEDNITVWFRKNGSDVSASAGIITVPGKHGSVAGAVISSWNLFLQISATDYVEMYWSTDSGNSVLQTFPAGTTPVHPISPAIIFTANQIA
jgi:hypothetical protein